MDQLSVGSKYGTSQSSDFVYFFRFVREYVQQSRRGYGANTSQVLQKLRASRFAEVYTPAREQYGGMGSFGNGGAIRIGPVALYCHEHKDGQQMMVDVARKATEITHSHKDACNGAILQASDILNNSLNST